MEASRVPAEGRFRERSGEGAASAETGGRPTVLIIGPTPPPHHGMTTITLMLLASPILRERYRVVHLDTADRRSYENMGRLDLRNVTLALEHAGRLAWLVGRHRPDVVYVQVSQNAWAYLRDAVFIAIAKALGSRVLTHLNGAGFRDFYEGSNALCRWLVRRTSRWIDGAAVLSGRLRGIYDGLVPDERVHVLPNGMEDPVTREGSGAGADRPIAAEVGATDASDAPVLVTYIGTLVRSKGFQLLMEAVAGLRSEGVPVRLVCAGSWMTEEDRSTTEALLSRPEIREAVELPGVVTGTAKWGLLARTDIFALPTSYPPEGQPFAILEAMAMGVPVVATARGAIPDMVRPGVNGAIVAEGDVEALMDGLRPLVRDPELRARMGSASRRIYETEFTEVQSTRRLVELLDEVRGAP